MITKPPPAMSVAVIESAAFVRIPGRANFTLSVEFKTLVSELRIRGVSEFILDLGECITMDSTFLGVLAGLAMRNADGVETTSDGERLKLQLLNPNPRVTDLLDNLGVIQLFTIRHEENPCTALFEPIRNDRPAPSKDELSRNCLEAHEFLMRINPNNIPKFKEVTQFLAEDLRKSNSRDGQR